MTIQWHEIRDDCLSFIMDREGRIPTPYLCSANVPTIGIGHVIKPQIVYGTCNGRFIIEKCQELRKESKSISEANHKIRRFFGDIMTTKQAMELFEPECKKYFTDIMRFIPSDLKGNQIIALTSFAFNLGIQSLKDSTLLKRIVAENWEDVPNQFLRWNKAGGKVVAGLTTRRKLESELFMRNIYIK